MSLTSSIKPMLSARVGLILLLIPAYFIGASLLRQNAPGLSLLGSPVILLGTLLLAFALNALSILSVDLRRDAAQKNGSKDPPLQRQGQPLGQGQGPDAPSVLNISLSLRFWNLAVMGASLLLLGVVFGYAFVENFQPRAVN